ncbi:MAG: hypothetical protein KJ597_04595 [Nanoarchaeota archaeon]|nr:hypothetical protein [Nanoarchaeota archaeon]MBU1622825.1 hypothetical protein [Nanoarchaeota archaeon]
MDINKLFTKKRIIFLLLFFALVLIGKNINFSAVVGADSQFFTLFQFFGPTAGAFLGPVFGIIAVAFSQIADFVIIGKEWSILSLLRFLPMLFAVYYFGTFIKNKKTLFNVLVPLVCIGLFILHPVGRAAWIFSLYWLIPVLAVILPKKVPGQLFFRSYGATFAAHAIGSVIWLYTVPMEAGAWLGLIPIVAYERFLFGLGIAGSYILFTTVLDYVVKRWKVSDKILFLEKKYTLIRLLHLKKS